MTNYILAGNYAQYKFICNQKKWNPNKDAKYIGEAHHLRGLSHGILYLYGTYWKHQWYTSEESDYLLQRGWKIERLDE